MMVRFKRGWWKTYGTLTPGNLYRVIGVEADNLRILDDIGGPFLFARRAFDVVDATEPNDWIGEVGEDGERYAYPPELSARGFFEDWHDGVRDVRAKLSSYLHRRCWDDANATEESANSYVRLRPRLASANAPVAIYVELDELRCEVRKVEELIDGRRTFAEGRGASGETQLGALPVPTLAELTADSQFEASAMTRQEFETIWESVVYSDVD